LSGDHLIGVELLLLDRGAGGVGPIDLEFVEAFL
jgi:hypothetical protein